MVDISAPKKKFSPHPQIPRRHPPSTGYVGDAQNKKICNNFVPNLTCFLQVILVNKREILVDISAPKKKKNSPAPPKFPADTLPAPCTPPRPLGEPPPSWEFQLETDLAPDSSFPSPPKKIKISETSTKFSFGKRGKDTFIFTKTTARFTSRFRPCEGPKMP